jgi:VanZ family protein
MFSWLIKLSRKLAVPLGWTIFTQVLVSIPGKFLEGPGLFSIPHLDKIAHIILFGGLSIFWILFFHYRKTGEKKYTSLVILLLLAAYGVGIEYYQLNFIPNRSFDVGDIVADICGALCGYFATILILRNAQAGKLSG